MFFRFFPFFPRRRFCILFGVLVSRFAALFYVDVVRVDWVSRTDVTKKSPAILPRVQLEVTMRAVALPADRLRVNPGRRRVVIFGKLVANSFIASVGIAIIHIPLGLQGRTGKGMLSI